MMIASVGYKPRRVTTGVLVAMALLCLSPRAVKAQDSAYCRKVRARAQRDVTVLLWPRVLVEGRHVPANGGIDFGDVVGKHYQGRVGLAFSPIEALRGLRVLDAADADCELQAIAEPLGSLIRDASDERSLPAFRAEANYLASRRAKWQALLAQANDRLESGVITTMEFQDLRRLIAALQRKHEAAAGQVKRLEARSFAPAPGSLHEMTEEYVRRTLRLERRLTAVGSLDPWQFNVGGGVVPVPGQPLDWYAIVEVSYSLGGLSRHRHEAEYLHARADELRDARYELPARLAELRGVFQAQIEQLRRELDVVQAQLASIAGTLASLGEAEATDGAPEQAQAVLELEQIALESDRIYLRALVEALVAMIDEPEHDPETEAVDGVERAERGTSSEPQGQTLRLAH